MANWFYKATSTKVSFEDTRDLAVNEGFLCRSAFEENKSRADNTQHVEFGDLLQVYFTRDGSPRVIGTFQVVGPNRHPSPTLFGKAVQGTRLFEVANPAFEQKLRILRGSEGYQPDPILKKMTGWILKHRPDIATPPFSDAPFTNRATLVRGR